MDRPSNTAVQERRGGGQRAVHSSQAVTARVARLHYISFANKNKYLDNTTMNTTLHRYSAARSARWFGEQVCVARPAAAPPPPPPRCPQNSRQRPKCTVLQPPMTNERRSDPALTVGEEGAHSVGASFWVFFCGANQRRLTSPLALARRPPSAT
ncbi:uncharacterized protein LOC126774742 [Nymphalis io]|uniref:uncharacterized protein LOC126774742 n=1 Tax=Inachis io TaxID=171585 RepID=UPI00216737BA|nr:uncharacterized protein LOC126774742 [Nymphalis io]